jgi:hypothetical protein
MPSDRAGWATTLLAIAVVILLGQAIWQQTRVHALRSQLEQLRDKFDTEVAKAATERLRPHRAEILEAQQWLHDFYASAEGLQRPNGLWRDDRKQPDFEGISTWVFDVYLTARLSGASHEEARRAIEDAIRSSDEWKRVHAPK